MFSDATYFVPLREAHAATVAVLSRSEDIAELQENVVGTDWTYDGRTQLGQAGEEYVQSRRRSIVRLAQEGAEVRFSTSVTNQTRTHFASGEASGWESTEVGTNSAHLAQKLQDLEKTHFANMRAEGNPGPLLDIFARHLPEGYSVVERSERRLVADKIVTKSRVREKRGLQGTWDARHRVIVDVGETSIGVTGGLDNRFSTEEGVGEWQRGASLRAERFDLKAAAMREAIPHGLVVYGDRAIQEVALDVVAFTEPPAPPRLRDMSEIQEIITRRAYETATGDFTVCLDHIVVSPRLDSGEVWDLPLAEAALTALARTAEEAGTVMGALNRLADEQPMVGMALDRGTAAAMSYAGGPPIDRHQLEQIAMLTSKVADFTNLILPTSPDLQGTFEVQRETYPIGPYTDQLQMEPRICHRGIFRPNTPLMQVTMYDIDLYEHDLIGNCTLGLGDVIARGVSGISCGYGRLYMRGIFEFSFDQIEIVGLPPVQGPPR